MAVSEDDVRHVAALARLGLTDERISPLVTELNGILEHMEDLQQVDISSVVDLPDVSHGMRMREDVPNPIELLRAREEFAPGMRDGFFLVPRLSTHGATDAGDEDGE